MTFREFSSSYCNHDQQLPNPNLLFVILDSQSDLDRFAIASLHIYLNQTAEELGFIENAVEKALQHDSFTESALIWKSYLGATE